nr:hypothetical protein [Tanacetum cinerariifolium]
MELFQRLQNDVQNIHEELGMYINTLNWDRPTVCYYDDDDEDYSIAVTPSLPTEEPDYSLRCIQIATWDWGRLLGAHGGVGSDMEVIGYGRVQGRACSISLNTRTIKPLTMSHFNLLKSNPTILNGSLVLGLEDVLSWLLVEGKHDTIIVHIKAIDLFEQAIGSSHGQNIKIASLESG